MTSEIHLTLTVIAGFICRIFSESRSLAQPDYVDNVCILLLSNSPKRRNRTAQDRVTVWAKEYRLAVRDDVQRKELPQVTHYSLYGVRNVSILLERNVLDISSKIVQLWLQEIFQHFKCRPRLEKLRPQNTNSPTAHNEIFAANDIVYRLCILKQSTVNLIIHKRYAFKIHPFILTLFVLYFEPLPKRNPGTHLVHNLNQNTVAYAAKQS